MCLCHILGTYVGLVTHFCVVKRNHCTWNVFTPHSRITAQTIVSHIECVSATFKSNCAKDHESCGMCLRHVLE